ncbi:porin family protein [Fluviicola sp.]|uniref:porin family protein n=1 Tax=Fluviicola sp. TaxID=1917219 RepID=UPI0031E40A92
MKKILIMAAAVLTSSALFSQEAPQEKIKTISLGPAVGFGHTGIRNTAGTDIFKPAWKAGLIFNYSSRKHVGFAADVLWSQEGARVKDQGLQADVNFQYIRVPLKFAYYFGAFEDNFRPKITVGPSMGFLLHATSYVMDLEKVDVTDNYEKFDVGVNASIGFNWKVATNMWLNTDFNYYTSFLPVYGSQYNSNFGVQLGLAFGL